MGRGTTFLLREENGRGVDEVLMEKEDRSGLATGLTGVDEEQ